MDMLKDTLRMSEQLARRTVGLYRSSHEDHPRRGVSVEGIHCGGCSLPCDAQV